MNNYAISVTIDHDNGSTTTRVYVRGAMRLSREAFNAFAIGHLLAMVTSGYSDSTALNVGHVETYSIDAISWTEVPVPEVA